MVCPFPKMLISFIITKIVDIDMQVTNNMHGGYIITCEMQLEKLFAVCLIRNSYPYSNGKYTPFTESKRRNEIA